MLPSWQSLANVNPGLLHMHILNGTINVIINSVLQLINNYLEFPTLLSIQYYL